MSNYLCDKCVSSAKFSSAPCILCNARARIDYLNAENERLQAELDESRHTPSNTAMWKARYEHIKEELVATETSWSNAELREAALRKRIEEGLVVNVTYYEIYERHQSPYTSIINPGGNPLRLNPGESCPVRIVRKED